MKQQTSATKCLKEEQEREVSRIKLREVPDLRPEGLRLLLP